MAWPRIVAESLSSLRQPVQVAAQRPTAATIAATLDAIEAARAPTRSSLQPPVFLQAHQHDPWRRVMAALAAWRGALLLEPVGRGKTWIALAVAACENRPAVAMVPAILQEQWSNAARQAQIPLHLWTHERLSRGSLPDLRPSLVIVDEAHRCRDGSTRRVQTLAPWLVGRRTLLLTATPIVNRLGDLLTLLRLALPEDALALDGVARLEAIETATRSPSTGLRRVAIRSAAPGAPAIRRRTIVLPPDTLEGDRGARAVAAIGALALSDTAAIRRLLESVLLDAAASSDAAFRRALLRYRALLLQARDAGGASRSMLRRFAGESLEQLVLWPLLATEPSGGDLPLRDIVRVEQLTTGTFDDAPWMRALMGRCDDARPTIWFTRHRATARQLRNTLGDGTAWITGSEAGIGPHRVPRAGLLSAFGPARASWQLRRAAPRVLVATDVAAEGLDLHAAGRIVHVDLPWTAMRIDQREGRLVRLGQQHDDVEVVIRRPAPAIERALAPRARIQRKRRAADTWLHSLETTDPIGRSPTGGAAVTCLVGAPEGGVVAVRLERDGRAGVMLMTRHEGDWQLNDAAAEELLARATRDHAIEIAIDGVTSELLGACRAAIRTAVASGAGAPSTLVGRVHRLARQAAAARDGITLQVLDRLLRFIIAAPTLGGRMLLVQLANASDHDLLRREVPDLPAAGPVQAMAIAAVLFRSHRRALR